MSNLFETQMEEIQKDIKALRVSMENINIMIFGLVGVVVFAVMGVMFSLLMKTLHLYGVI